MKYSDDYEAKIKIWAQDPKPQPEIPVPPLPKFSPKRFNSYEEFNRWKDDLIKEIAREAAERTK
jgi:hypothetical protein